MKFKVFGFALIASFFAFNSAYAVVVFEQPSDPDGFGIASQLSEDRVGDVKQLFDSFTLDVKSEVTSVDWFGFGLKSQSFAIEFYADDASAQFAAPDLGTMLYREIVTVDAKTSVDSFVRQYSTELAAPVSFSPEQRYWVSFVGLNESFAWTISRRSTGEKFATQYDHKKSWFKQQPAEMAFTLLGTTVVSPPAPTVPLPAAFPLFIAGISGIVAMGCRRRKSEK